MLSIKSIVLPLIAAALINPAWAETTALQGPIATLGHGGMFDANGKEINPSMTFLLDAQIVYKNLLLSQLPINKRKKYDQELEALAKPGLSPADQVHINTEAINRLIKEVNPSNKAQLNAINTTLHEKYGKALAKSNNIPIKKFKFMPSTSLADALKKNGFDLSVTIPKTNLSGQAYVSECRAQGVPIPPDWGNSSWIFRGNLTKKFIIQGQVAAVYTYESTSPRGICIALPRYPSGSNTVSALGIICQGNDANKACFWDNANDILLNGSITPIVSSSFKGGAALLNGNGVCTDCHAGQNPFVVHPNSPLDRGSILNPTGWVKPLVHPDWPQNPGPTTVLNNITLNSNEKSCLSCHNSTNKFPQLSLSLPGYCSTILNNAYNANGTMPPGRPGDSSYLKHINALQAACSGVTPSTGRNPNNRTGNTNSEACLNDCNQELDLCMAEAGQPGAPRKAQCMMAFRSCQSNCTNH